MNKLLTLRQSRKAKRRLFKAVRKNKDNILTEGKLEQALQVLKTQL